MLKHTTLALAASLVALPGLAAADDWRPLLTDDSLREWRSGGGDAFRASGGTLTVDGTGQIVYVGGGKPLDLTSFELKAEALTRPGGRGGLAFHKSPDDARSSGGIEVRLDNSHGSRGPGQGLVKTGSLVWLRPVVKSVVPDDKWFRLHVTVRGKRVQVRVEDRLLVDYVEPENAEGLRLRKGSIAVRGHGGSGAVLVRNLQVRPLADDGQAAPVKLDETGLRLANLREQGFSLVDFHARSGGGRTLDDLLAWSRQTGLGAGLAVPCGEGLAAADDRSALKLLQSAEGRPVFVGLLAEGRDWTRLLSPETVARFDYVLADARTLTDARGRRLRLWVKEEVDVPDPQAFMDLLVKSIEQMLDREPIDVYANPTYLPEVLAKDYDRLWTAERLGRVVDALARNGVALEINDRLRLPGPALIKLARRKGVKFALGSGSEDKEPGRLEYCLRMIGDCALTPEDLWAPKPDGKKPVQVRKR